MNFFLSLFVAYLLLIILDILWFKLYSYKRIYKPQFEKLNNKTSFFLRKSSAFVTWFVMALAIATLGSIIDSNPSTKKSTFLKIVLGAWLGFTIYAVYNGTNYSTLEKYELKTVVYDTLWGTFVFGVVTMITNM